MDSRAHRSVAVLAALVLGACTNDASSEDTDSVTNDASPDATTTGVGPGSTTRNTGSDSSGSDDGESETGGTQCPANTVPGEDGACHCGDSGGEVCDQNAYCDAMGCVEAVCGDAVIWAAGTQAFREATDAWGLTGVQGVRLSVTDIDGDGWADLHVRTTTQAEDFAGTRTSWLMRNTGAGFEDVTQASGILTPRGDLDANTGRPAAVVASADVDNDGDLDILTGIDTGDTAVSLGETTELMINQGDGTFALGPESSDIRRAGETDAVAGISFVDVNRDGWVDVWVTEHGLQDRLYYGDGQGGFVDVTLGSGLGTAPGVDVEPANVGAVHSRAWSALACDLDGDGNSELLAGSYGRSTNHLWQPHVNEDNVVVFDPRQVESGYARDEDYAWDGNQFARCFCQANPDAEDCDEVPAPSITCGTPNWNHASDREPYRLGGNSGATACADLDNDGDMDLYTSEIRHWWAGAGSDMSEALLNVSDGDGLRFERPGRDTMGIVVEHVTGASWDEGHMSLTTLDFDNDGRRDIYVGASDYPGNRGLLFHQRESGGGFEPVSTEDSFEHNRSHGVVAADFDRDGDLDLIVGHSRSRCDANAPNDCYETSQVRAFENTYGQDASYIQLRLEGTSANRAAIGARVRVTANGVTQTQDVGGGFGHYGAQDDMVLHFGLGDACAAEIEIRWPNGDLETQHLTLPAGHRFGVVQGEPASLED